jgi:hypothetical protein
MDERVRQNRALKVFYLSVFNFEQVWRIYQAEICRHDSLQS